MRPPSLEPVEHDARGKQKAASAKRRARVRAGGEGRGTAGHQISPRRRRPMATRPAKPVIISAYVDGSGTTFGSPGGGGLFTKPIRFLVNCCISKLRSPSMKFTSRIDVSEPAVALASVPIVHATPAPMLPLFVIHWPVPNPLKAPAQANTIDETAFGPVKGALTVWLSCGQPPDPPLPRLPPPAAAIRLKIVPLRVDKTICLDLSRTRGLRRTEESADRR
ncbi:MAG: hypothetical protein U5K74_02125 [Gemmatimonadaceae bacterium]|nr:hypothetical protein [Gemmatimonadaceae bacterium]